MSSGRDTDTCFIMTSQWRVARLSWSGKDGWSAVHDRPIGVLDDAAVLAQFGDEAFRRRDELLASGERWYEPKIARLISRRVVQRFVEQGWCVEIDQAMSDVDDIFRVSSGERALSVRLPKDDRWSLEFSVDGGAQQQTTSLGQVEQWLLTHGAT